MSSRYLPVVLFFVGTILSVAVAWLGYRSLDDSPQANELIIQANKAAKSRRPAALTPATISLEAESRVAKPVRPASTRPQATPSAVAVPTNKSAAAAGKPAAGPPQSPLPESAPLELSADADGMVVRAMSLAPDGILYVALAKPTAGTLCGLRETESRGEIWSYDSMGRRLVRRQVAEFAPQAILAARDGIIYVGGQGLVARFSSTGEELGTTELISRRDTVLIRSQAKASAPEKTWSALASRREAVARLDRFILDIEKTISSVRSPRRALTELRESTARTRDTMKSELSELELSSRDENEQAIVDGVLRIGRIVQIGGELFILNNGAVERSSSNGSDQQIVLPREGRSYLDMRAAEGELLVQSEWGVFERYNTEGKRLESTCLIYDRRLSEYFSKQPGLRIHLNGPFGFVGGKEMVMPDEFGSILRWTTSGKMLDVVLDGIGEFGTGKNRMIETSVDGKRIYISAVGQTKIDRLRPAPAGK